jgi:hypothetical protein
MNFPFLALTLCGLGSIVSGSTFSPARPPAIPLAGMLLGRTLETCLTINSKVSVHEYLVGGWPRWWQWWCASWILAVSATATITITTLTEKTTDAFGRKFPLPIRLL